MANLKVTARLLAGFAAFDDWSPDLAGLLEWLILDARGMAAPNPTPDDVKASRPVVEAHMPLARGEIGGEWYWATSAPCYTYSAEYVSKFRKRWSPGIDCPAPEWGKRKAKWSGSEGQEKNYDLPNYIRVTDAVTWYCQGEADGIRAILEGCTGLGKKRGHGHGQVSHWEVTEHEADWHLWGPFDELMRPIPITALPETSIDFGIRDWGWRPPAWLPANKTRCAMPVHTCRKVDRAIVARDGRSLAI